MKVLHVPFGYFPDPPGGTELYVQQLAHEQRALGHSTVIAAPASEERSYAHGGDQVRRFARASSVTLDELWGGGDAVAAASFGRILDDERPDLVHLHAYTTAISRLLLRQTRERGIPQVFTYHTPTSSCPRGTLRRWGKVTCDGQLLDHRCGACVLAANGMPRSMAIVAEPVTRAASKLLLGRSGGVVTGIRLPQLVSVYIAATHEFLNGMQRIVVLANWTEQVLRINGIAADRLRRVPHGLLRPIQGVPKRSTDSGVRLAYFGRLDPLKGIHLVVEALRTQPDLDVELSIYGVAQSEADNEYAALIRRRTAEDARIELLPPVPHEQLSDALAQADAVVVPSLLLETGPLVVLEAFAAGRPVLGSNLGGIAEKVRDGIDGLLVEPRIEDWRATLQRIATDRELLERLGQNVTAPRTMQEVAKEVDEVYRSVRP